MTDTSINEWLDSLAARQPTPGGGAVAALAAAMAAAQLNMVTAYTTGPKWQDRETEMHSLSQKLGKLRVAALDAAKQDAAAFGDLSAAYKLPRDSDSQKNKRQQEVQQALAAAAEPPAKTAELAGQITGIANKLVDSGNPNVISDVAVGASMARAALESAIVNIEINIRELHDAGTKKRLQSVIENSANFIQNADVVIKAVREHLRGNT